MGGEADRLDPLHDRLQGPVVEAQGEGIGRRLVEQVLGVLGPVAVWVLATNPARGFYERLGARYLTERRVMKPDATFIEAAYALG